MDTESLWKSWRKCFCCDDRAIALAIKICNKLVKQDIDKKKRRKFYKIKDEFIMHNDRNIAYYQETMGFNDCPICRNINPEKCNYCHGDGLMIVTMYECHMKVAGLTFSLHSFLSPEEFTRKARDLDEEHPHFHKRNELPKLSIDEYIELLSYAVLYAWGLELDYEDEYLEK